MKRLLATLALIATLFIGQNLVLPVPDDPGWGVRIVAAATSQRATTLPPTILPAYVAADHPACFGTYLFIDDGSGRTVYNDRAFGTVCIVTFPGASVFYLAPGQSLGFWHP